MRDGFHQVDSSGNAVQIEFTQLFPAVLQEQKFKQRIEERSQEVKAGSGAG